MPFFWVSTMALAYVHSYETFGSVDGPGVRFVLFLQGCKMRCQYCHNPDTWKLGIGEQKSAREILDFALRYRSYWGDEGGITVSGGEPLLQMEFLLEFFKMAKAEGVHTTIDTSGWPFTHKEPFFSQFEELMRYTDLVMLDLKHIDEVKHRELTKQSNASILDCARYLDEIGKDVWIRHVLVPQHTDDDGALQRLSDFIATLHNVRRVEVLPYHSFGMYKWQELGLKYDLTDINPPTQERVINAEKILKVGSYH